MNKLVALLLLISFYVEKSYSNIDDYFKFPIQPSSANLGNTGILEIPNAKFMDPGSPYLLVLSLFFFP